MRQRAKPVAVPSQTCQLAERSSEWRGAYLCAQGLVEVCIALGAIEGLLEECEKDRDDDGRLEGLSEDDDVDGDRKEVQHLD